ncbi:MAG: hypothetical protein R3321_15055, partial [Nitrososphaeraceae archaeon]|nr:hypothetical protein [Nitrososphaeraceae archaeon]
MSNNTLTYWFPDKSSFRYIDAGLISPTAAKAMEEEKQIRDGWLMHPQIGIGSGQKMIDVGSRYGEYTLSALALGADFVWAFEKNPQLVKYLREMLRINNNSFVERCSVINRVISPITTNLDHYFFEELSSVPDGVKWLKIDVGGQDELNILFGARKLVEYYSPISVLVHHYDGQAGHQALTEQFLAANGYDAKSVGIKIS